MVVRVLVRRWRLVVAGWLQVVQIAAGERAAIGQLKHACSVAASGLTEYVDQRFQDFRFWLLTDIPAMRDLRLLYPRKQT